MRFVINLLLFSVVCNATVPLADTSPTDHRRSVIEQLTENPGEESIQRKARSIAVLEARSVPYIEWLPVIADTDQSLRRNENAIVKRLVALAIVAVKGETGDHKLSQDLLEQFQARDFLAPLELNFMNNPTPSDNDLIQFVWRYESAWVMLRALGFATLWGRRIRLLMCPGWPICC